MLQKELTHYSPWKWVTQSCPTFCDPMDYMVHGILQARILEWVAFLFSRGSSQAQGSNSGFPHCRQILYQLSHQGSHSPRARCLLLWVKFYWNTATLVCLCIVYGCFLSTTPELSNWGRDHMAHKASNVYYLALYSKSVPIPVERTVPITSACLREEKHRTRIKFSLWPYFSQQPLDLGWHSHHVLQMRKLRYRRVKWHSQKVPKPRPKPGQAGFIRLASSYWVR